MSRKKSNPPVSFVEEAANIFNMPIATPINALGGYGPEGQVVYQAHPVSCPSVLVDSRASATATFMSNGSTAFEVKIPEGLDVKVLGGNFDAVEKREVGVPVTNLWLDVDLGSSNLICSLLNPAGSGSAPEAIRVVKLGDPQRAMWYASLFSEGNFGWSSAVRHSMVLTSKGPALLRQVCITNQGRRKLKALLWSYYDLHGTQRFVYNKPLWYDSGLPLSGRETVVSASVPYSEIVQIKRLSSRVQGMKSRQATCDYSEFVGDSAASAFLPEAVRNGAMLECGAGSRLNRFATSTIAANSYSLELAAGESAVLEQSLLYVTDPAVQKLFRRLAESKEPTYRAVSASFKKAAKALLLKTPALVDVVVAGRSGEQARAGWPDFEFAVPGDMAVSEYAKSVWTGVPELYENCRAHGEKMAEGIELGTRDRGQDMWPKMKEDPGRVRSDLVHAFSFMYVTCKNPESLKGRLTLEQKLHGMYPRQFPSRWDNRNQEVMNDNRPYTDSPLWLINSLCRYLRETGDLGILKEQVGTINLTDPARPETSGIKGCARRQSLLEAVLQIFACFERHAKDTPYGMAQILYGDWCDPIDMYGTGVVGDPATRGQGRGVQIRLSAHLFECLVDVVDALEAPAIAASIKSFRVGPRVQGLKKFAGRLRANIIKWGWEDGKQAGFLDCIHELRADGSRPDYRGRESGYTLGSMNRRDFDRVPRRCLAPQAFGLKMLLTRRDWLKKPAGAQAMAAKVLKTIDSLFYRDKLGLSLFTTPVASNQKGIDMVGRLGVFPIGCGENGEYHHGQVMMHLVRLGIPGQADVAWKQFKLVMSSMRQEDLCGPFDMPATSYGAAPGDPHFGKGMYFGLSGSTDWIVQIYERVAGLELNLADKNHPDVLVAPNLPRELGGQVRLCRKIHQALPGGGYRVIPLEIVVNRSGSGRREIERRIKINGRRAEQAQVASIAGLKRLRIEIDLLYGK
jgi:hypothetical protein